MSLRDLLFSMRQHPAFPDLLKAVADRVPEVKQFRPSKEGAPDQYAEWIFRSGKNAQLDEFRHLLTDWNPPSGEVEPSQQEKL